MPGSVTRDQIIAVTAVKRFKKLVTEYKDPNISFISRMR